jgi:hypothetical protein
VLLAYRWFEERVIDWKKFAVFSISPFIVLVLTGSRTGMFGILLIGLYYIMNHMKTTLIRIVLVLIVLASLVLITPLSAVLFERIGWTINEVSVMYESMKEFSLSKDINDDLYKSWWVILWHFIFLLMIVDPLTGVGFGSVPLLTLDLFGGRGVQIIHTAGFLKGELLGFSLHNSYADLAIGFGIPYCVLLVYLVVKAMRNERYKYYITNIFLGQFLFESFFHPTITGNGAAMYFLAVMIGLAAWERSRGDEGAEGSQTMQKKSRRSKFHRVLLEARRRRMIARPLGEA